MEGESSRQTLEASTDSTEHAFDVQDPISAHCGVCTLRDMRAIYENAPENGPKTEVEDAMYPMYAHAVYNLNPRACSIDTPLHTLVPHKHVDHLHPNAVIAIARRSWRSAMSAVRWRRCRISSCC